MSITSSIGLVSGIDHGSLIEQLMSIEARSQSLVKNQTSVLQSQQVAFQSVNAKLLVLKMSASTLTKSASFVRSSVSSSNDLVATASAAATATPGSYSFSVARLVSTQQAISRGVADKDATPFAAGTLTFESGQARLDTDTLLSSLHGGQGITRGKIRVSDRSGASAVVDLSQAVTVNDVLKAINNASGVNVSAQVQGDRFVLTDHTGQSASALAVADLSGSNTAATLGLLGNAGAGDTLQGQEVNALGRDTHLSQLNDGNGVSQRQGLADFTITAASGMSLSVDLSTAQTLGDVMDLINQHADNTGQGIVASLDGTRIKITDQTTGGILRVEALNDSQAAADLGILGQDDAHTGEIQGQRILASLNSKLIKNLRGGQMTANFGVIDINATQVDLSAATSVADVIHLINQSGAGVTASLNDAGNGLRLTHDTGGALTVADLSGNAASFLGLDQSDTTGRIDSGSLQLRYISQATQLATLNAGKGVAKGNFTITDSNGHSATVDMSDGDEKTIQDVLSDINSRGLAIHARINDQGDGITIEDLGSGAVAIKVGEIGSTTARDLGLLGEAGNPGDHLVGTFEKKVQIAQGDTLADIASKINDAGVGVTASIFSDGSPSSPHRLSLLSNIEGTAGAFVMDDGGLGLGISNLAQAQDAVVFFGSNDPAKAVAVVSSSNTLNALIPGVTVNLRSVSQSPVTIAISRDDSAAVDAVKKFVDDFNGVMDTINNYDKYDADTQTRGLLLGDSTLGNIRNALYRQITGRNNEVPGIYHSLSQIGLTLGNGAKLQFDEAKFNAALSTDRSAVLDLFTFKETQTDEDTQAISVTKAGFGTRIEELLNRMTDTVSGTMKNTLDGLTARIDQNNKRVVQMQTQLDAKRARLEYSFAQMETALAQMQNQTSALNSLAQIASSYSASRSNK